MRPRCVGGLALLLTLGSLSLVGCIESPDTSSGLESIIRVAGGQAIRGSIADPQAVPLDGGVGSKKLVARINPVNSTIFPGASNKSLIGSVGGRANAVAIGVAGDVAYWRLPALDQDSTDPDTFDFTASFSISRELATSSLLQANPDGTWTLPLSARAVDNDGNFGPASIQPLVLDATAIVGTLAVSLQWDTPTDLDLHVLVQPNNGAGYVEVWSKHRSADPGNAAAGASPDGTLDFDSNANCQIDGRELENVIWKRPPPAGHYVVRVAAASLCGVSSAAWYAYASVPGVSKGSSSGVLTEAATRSSAGAGSGVTAFEFDYP